MAGSESPTIRVGHARAFSDESLERKYKEYLVQRYMPLCVGFLKYSGIISIVWVVFVEIQLQFLNLSEVQAKESRVNRVVFGATFIVTLFAKKAAKRNSANIENIMLCALLGVAGFSLLGLASSIYYLSANKCFIMVPSQDDIKDGELKECARSWVLSVAATTIIFNFVLIAGSNVGVLRRRKFKLFVIGVNIIHMVRFLVLSPTLPGIYANWIGLFNIVIPMLYYHLGLKAEMNKREMFLMQLHLVANNEELASKLVAAENALAFEAPTTAERSVVQNVILEAEEEVLDDLEVPFKELALCARIASGAFGEVIRAEYAGTQVAVKRLLRHQINEASIRMLMQEITLLRDLRHANIVTLVGVSWDSVANICIILEYMARGSLLGILEDPQLELSWQDPKLKMLTDIASGLAYLHSRPPPVVHRDLKPDNVLITPTYGCKLTDFGAARKSELDATMTQIGTQSYMAPEVIKGVRYDEKVDVYSLGILMVVMHTRAKAFPPDRLKGQSVLAFVLGGGRPEVPDDIPCGLGELAEACWQEEPGDRPSSERVIKILTRGGVLMTDSSTPTNPTIPPVVEAETATAAEAAAAAEVVVSEEEKRWGVTVSNTTVSGTTTHETAEVGANSTVGWGSTRDELRRPAVSGGGGGDGGISGNEEETSIVPLGGGGGAGGG